jgi:GH24 family phage-related lysozyme (muramidase)
LKAYPDPATGGEPITIGYGHTQPGLKLGVVWTQAQADAALEADLARFARGVWNAIGEKETTQNRFDALVSFAFNVGLGNLLSSTLLRKHVAGDYAGAADQFIRWNKAAGKVLNGLTRRREAEAKLYRGQA